MLTKRQTRRIGFALAGTAIAAVTTYGVAVGVSLGETTTPLPPGVSESDHSGSPVTYAAAKGSAASPVASDEASRRVLSGMKDTDLVSVTSSTAPSGRTIAVQLAHNNDEVPDVWLAGVAAGAFLEMTHTDETVASDAAGKMTAAGTGRDGSSVTTELGLGAVSLNQVFNSPSDSVLRTRVDNVARDFGLKVADLRVLHPLESALQVSFVVPDDSKIDWTIDELRAALVGKTPDIEGLLIELDAADGQKLLLAGTAYRTGEGGLWFSPGQDERFNAIHGTLARR